MKSTKFLKAVLCTAFAILLIISMAPIASQAKSGGLTLPEKQWVDGTHAKPLWDEQKPAPAPIDLEAHSGGGPGDPPDFTSEVGDWETGERYTQNFHWVMTGEHCYMYVAYDLGPDPENYYDEDADEYVFENPLYPTGGWCEEDRISTAQLTFMMNEFDSNIYPTMTSTFGLPFERPSGETKIYCLIMNIRDPSYYDGTIDWHVIGYFSYGEDVAANKNMIHIDSYDWANRLGPNVARPFTYESTFAHEFQHLIHQDRDPDEESWIDEACSMFAEYHCGYGHSAGHIAYYFAYHPWTALTFWGNALEDYGAVYLFALYMYEHFGGTQFMIDLVYNELNGIAGVEDTLNIHGYTITFDEVFHNWAIANYIDDTTAGNGEYGYYSLNIPSADTWGYSIQYILWNWYIGMEFPRGFGYCASWFWGMPQPYAAHYWEYAFNAEEGEVNFIYGGDPVSGISANSGSYHWYGGMGNWVWRQLYQTLSIPADATLSFYTYFEIETDWDYFYVEVHDLTEGTWTTLPGIHTTSTLPNPQDNPNCDDLREPEAYETAGEWHALTGFSSDFEDPAYYQEEMDLTPFAGHNIELYFVYWTDGAYNELGVYIDDIEITGYPLDDVEAGEGDWTSTGWERTTGLLSNSWEGEVFTVTGIDNYRTDMFWNHIRDRFVNFLPGKLHNVWWIDELGLLNIPLQYVNEGYLYVAVFWNGVSHTIPADYCFVAL